MASMYRSVNPVNNKLFHTAVMHTDAQLENKIANAYSCYIKNKHRGAKAIQERLDKLSNVHSILEKNRYQYAEIMAKEMGKPIA